MSLMLQLPGFAGKTVQVPRDSCFASIPSSQPVQADSTV